MDRLVESYRKQYGAGSQDRTSFINSLFRDIVDFSLPQTAKYLIWSSGRQKGVFADSEEPAEQHEEEGFLTQDLHMESVEGTSKINSSSSLSLRKRRPTRYIVAPNE